MSKAEDLRDRTKKFAIRIVHLFRALPKSNEAQAANYRAVGQGRGPNSSPESE